jgi:acyl-[acyl-carrier-protein] desaturase
MHQVSVGYSRAKLPNATDGMVYVALQELATRIAHRNTGKLLDDPAGQEVMKRVAADENYHYLFYRDLVAESLAADPSGTVQAIERQVECFEMPGTGIVDFKRHAQAIADAGIYDVAIHHSQILVPVIVRAWGVAGLTGLDDAAEAARDRLLDRIDRIGRIGARLAERRQQQLTAV